MADHLIFGEDDSIGTDPEETGLDNNVVIVGSSGCGKSVSFVIPRLLETADSDLFQKLLETSFPDGLDSSLLIKKIKEEND